MCGNKKIIDSLNKLNETIKLVGVKKSVDLLDNINKALLREDQLNKMINYIIIEVSAFYNINKEQLKNRKKVSGDLSDARCVAVNLIRDILKIKNISFSIYFKTLRTSSSITHYIRKMDKISDFVKQDIKMKKCYNVVKIKTESKLLKLK